MRPIIGILGEIDDELNTKILYAYIHTIEKSGGTPILFPFVKENETIDHLVNICDGFFFTGGVDIHSKYYGEEAGERIGKIQEYRDELEFNVLRRVIKTSKPILAVCRGAQLVNVALGGTLYQDIPSEVQTKILHRQSEPKFSHSHDVRIMINTPLYEMMKTERIKANSFHHQAIKTLASGLEIMALAEDGIIEAVYSSGRQYIRAYQWHPERLFEIDPQNRLIFEDFIRVCKS